MISKYIYLCYGMKFCVSASNEKCTTARTLLYNRVVSLLLCPLCPLRVNAVVRTAPCPLLFTLTLTGFDWRVEPLSHLALPLEAPLSPSLTGYDWHIRGAPDRAALCRCALRILRAGVITGVLCLSMSAHRARMTSGG